jgi:hypothetical protein
MAAVDLCSFNHGLGIYIRLFFPERKRGIKYEYKCPAKDKIMDKNFNLRKSLDFICLFYWYLNNRSVISITIRFILLSLPYTLDNL